ncbi:MAG: DUF1127 domain-containing protein [Gemmobacter sp.]
MAYATSSRSGSAERSLRGLIASVSLMLRRRRMYLRTMRELNALSTRELADLGLSRSMITRLALEAARAVD